MYSSSRRILDLYRVYPRTFQRYPDDALNVLVTSLLCAYWITVLGYCLLDKENLICPTGVPPSLLCTPPDGAVLLLPPVAPVALPPAALVVALLCRCHGRQEQNQ